MLTPFNTLLQTVKSGSLDHIFGELYGQNNSVENRNRYLDLLEGLEKTLPDTKTMEAMFVSAPGRTELGGNHTDHNNGCIVAAAVDLDCVAAVTPIDSNEIIIYSNGYDKRIHINVAHLAPRREEEGTAEALVRGVAAAFHGRTGKKGGFNAHLDATCRPGTGLSSSAAFAVLVGATLNVLYNKNKLTDQELAVIAQQAENVHFGKPCGLMDQMASAVGQTIFADFKDPLQPAVEKIAHSLSGTGYRLVIVDTGGSHIELTPEYALIPLEMQTAAKALGGMVGRDISLDSVVDNIADLREMVGDRAILRLLHFIEENKRAIRMAERLKDGDFKAFLELARLSGRSSCDMLQNCATVSSSTEQGIYLANALSELFFPDAVCRAHGGGFAGTVQAYVPEMCFPEYVEKMEQAFGAGRVYPVRIGRPGVCMIAGSAMVLPPTGSRKCGIQPSKILPGC